MVVGLWVIHLSESRSKPSSKNTRNPSGSLHIDSPDGYLDELFASMNDGEHEDDGDDDEPEITEEQIYRSQEFYANINRLSLSGEGDDGDDDPVVGSDDGIEGQLKGYEDNQQDEGEVRVRVRMVEAMMVLQKGSGRLLRKEKVERLEQGWIMK